MRKNLTFCLLVFLVVGIWIDLRPGRRSQASSGGSCLNGRFPLCADVNGDGKIDITDPILTLSWLFGGGGEPLCCADSSQGPLEWTLNQAIPMPGRRSLGRFQDNGDGTVSDLLTGLLWQQRTADWAPDGATDARD